MSKITLAALAAVAAALGFRSAPPPAAAPHAARPHATPGPASVPLEFSRIYWEYNASANDLGVHVTLDGEDWTTLKIKNPNNQVLFNVRGKGPYAQFGMTELFFEGAEPALDEVPLDDLLAKFPEGEYDFEGVTVDGEVIEGEWEFTHAIPDGPKVSSVIQGDFLRIDWQPVDSPPPGFPDRPIDIFGYQVIVAEDFQVTVPPSVHSVTVPHEFVATLAPGPHPFEVLAIEASANQTLTEGSFVK
jgi:hypothetical protein